MSFPGVVHFDIACSLADPNTFIVIEVFTDRQALDRQNAQGEVAKVLTLIMPMIAHSAAGRRTSLDQPRATSVRY